MNPNDSQDLEKNLHRVLRSLPGRTAPASLEARVMAELHRRAALPWWRKSHAHWPVSVRAGLFLLSAIAAALAVVGLIDLEKAPAFAGLPAAILSRFEWVASTRQFLGVAGDALASLVRVIPGVWLYGAAAAVASCYLTLAAIGATAYRTLAGGARSR